MGKLKKAIALSAILLLAACGRQSVELNDSETKIYDIEQNLAGSDYLQADVTGTLQLITEESADVVAVQGTLYYDITASPVILFEGYLTSGASTYDMTTYVGKDRYYQLIQSDDGEVLDSKDETISDRQRNDIQKKWMGFTDPKAANVSVYEDVVETYDYYAVTPEQAEEYYEKQLANIMVGMLNEFEMEYEVLSVSTKYLIKDNGQPKRIWSDATISTSEGNYMIQLTFEITSIYETISINAPA